MTGRAVHLAGTVRMAGVDYDCAACYRSGGKAGHTAALSLTDSPAEVTCKRCRKYYRLPEPAAPTCAQGLGWPL